MTKYNMDLERELRNRPLPDQQVTVSVERIVSAAGHKKSVMSRSVTGLAACAMAVVVLLFVVNGFMGNEKELPSFTNEMQGSQDGGAGLGSGIENEGELNPLNLTDQEWTALFDGKAQELGIEVLHREQIDENSELLFMVKDTGQPYGYRFIHAEYEKDKNNQYRKVQAFEYSPITNNSKPQIEAGNDWITYNWHNFQHNKEYKVQFAYGYIINPRVAEVRLSNEAGVYENAEVLHDSKGQGFWYKVMSDKIAEGSFYVEALNRHEDTLLKVKSEGHDMYARINNFEFLLRTEWMGLYNGDIVDPKVEVLYKEQINTNKWLMLLTSRGNYEDPSFYNLTFTKLVKVRDSYYPSALTVSVYTGHTYNEYYNRDRNNWFQREWSMSKSGDNPPEVYIFGMIRDPKVAAIRLTNHQGEQKTLEPFYNSAGEAFFLSFIPNGWIKHRELFYTEAIDENGLSLYKYKETINFQYLE